MDDGYTKEANWLTGKPMDGQDSTNQNPGEPVRDLEQAKMSDPRDKLFIPRVNTEEVGSMIRETLVKSYRQNPKNIRRWIFWTVEVYKHQQKNAVNFSGMWPEVKDNGLFVSFTTFQYYAPPARFPFIATH